MQNINKNIVAKALEKIVVEIGKKEMQSTCAYSYHQPKMPTNMNEMLKKEDSSGKNIL